MKKFTLYLLASVAASTLFAACDKTPEQTSVVEPIAVESVSLDEISLELIVGDEFTLTETVLPADAEDKTVSWSSNNEAVATVEDGVVSAVGTGTATITVTTTDGEKTDECVVNVGLAPIAVTDVMLGDTLLTLGIGDAITLTATVLPENADDKSVTWSSSDEAVVTVEAGVVTAVEEGRAIITVTTVDGGKTAICTVTVNPAVVPLENLELEEGEVSIGIKVEGDENYAPLALTPIFTPATATDKGIVWESENEEIVTVENGLLTGIGPGTTKVTATSVDGGFEAECIVHVEVPVTGVSWLTSPINTVVGDPPRVKIDHRVVIAPANATNKKVTYQSSDETFLTVEVDQDGSAYAVPQKAGTAIVTVTTEDGEFTADLTIISVDPVIRVTGVSWLTTPINTVVGDPPRVKIDHRVVITPSNATNKKVTYTSSDETLLTIEIDPDGSVYAVPQKAGTAVVTVRTEDRGHTADLTINASDPVVRVTGVSWLTTPINTVVGDPPRVKIDHRVVITPSNATNKKVTYTSSDETLLTIEIDPDGSVYAVPQKAGTAVVTVRTEDRGHTADLTINASDPVIRVTGVSWLTTPIYAVVGDPPGGVKIDHRVVITPSNATNKKVTYTSSDETLLTINETGSGVYAVPHRAGTAVVTVRTEDRGHTAELTIIIVEP